MKVTVKLPIEIPEKTISELIQISAERLATGDEDIFKDGRKTISVVRCKDCKWFNYSRPNFCHFFGAFFGGMEEDDYCSRGDGTSVARWCSVVEADHCPEDCSLCLKEWLRKKVDK